MLQIPIESCLFTPLQPPSFLFTPHSSIHKNSLLYRVKFGFRACIQDIAFVLKRLKGEILSAFLSVSLSDIQPTAALKEPLIYHWIINQEPTMCLALNDQSWLCVCLIGWEGVALTTGGLYQKSNLASVPPPPPCLKNCHRDESQMEHA